LKQNVVARYIDGRVVKGTTTDFSPRSDTFTIARELASGNLRKVHISFHDLKAVFFVKSLEGDRDYQERKLQIPGNTMGRRLLVTFRDGEVLRGTSLGTRLTSHGFLLFPADPGSNNKRIFVLREAVKEVRDE